MNHNVFDMSKITGYITYSRCISSHTHDWYPICLCVLVVESWHFPSQTMVGYEFDLPAAAGFIRSSWSVYVGGLICKAKYQDSNIMKLHPVTCNIISAEAQR